MNRFTVDTINDLSKIYANIKHRIKESGQTLESDAMFIVFYKKFTEYIFNKKRESNR